MVYTYNPKGVCSRTITIEVEDGRVKKITFEGGCAGNTQGVARLCEGLTIDEVIGKLKGIQCGLRGTSCPDQLALALEEIKEKLGE